MGVRASLLAQSLLLAAATGLLLAATTPAAAIGSFAVLGLASGVNATGSGAAWARTFGLERLGELQGVGEAARITAAAVGPLPLALAVAATGRYEAGVATLGVMAILCAMLSARWRPVASGPLA